MGQFYVAVYNVALQDDATAATAAARACFNPLTSRERAAPKVPEWQSEAPWRWGHAENAYCAPPKTLP
jgi:hypothetical protein